MLISDWSSDVCSSDLPIDPALAVASPEQAPRTVRGYVARFAASSPTRAVAQPEGVELAYDTVDWTPAEDGRITDAHYRTEERRVGKECVRTRRYGGAREYEKKKTNKELTGKKR